MGSYEKSPPPPKLSVFQQNILSSIMFYSKLKSNKLYEGPSVVISVSSYSNLLHSFIFTFVYFDVHQIYV